MVRDPFARVPLKIKLPLGFILMYLFGVIILGYLVVNTMYTPLSREIFLRLQSEALTLAALMFIPILIVLFFIVRYVIHPLGELQKMAYRIKEGDFSARNAIDTDDEIGALAKTSNLMAEAIQDRTRSLERIAADLKKSEHELRVHHNLLDTVIHAMTDGLIFMNFQGKVMLSNEAAGPLLDVINQANGHLHIQKCEYHMDENDECVSCMCNPSRHTSCVLTVNDAVYEILSTKVPTLYGSSKVLVARNITEREHMRRRQAHQERLTVLGKLAAVVAHEMNNPLAAISMYNQMMEEELPTASPYREHTEVIQRNTQICQRIIRELLDYARTPQPQIEEVDLHQLLVSIIQFLRPLHKKENVPVEQNFQAQNAVCRGDATQLQQVFVNLLINALQAIGKDDGTVWMRTFESEQKGILNIEIEDNGHGIDAAIADEIFEPFFTTKSSGGTGLGLPTARRVIQAHGGDVVLLASRPGKTIFRVTIPHITDGVEHPVLSTPMPYDPV